MLKTLQCRIHGGTFKIVAKRGRPPTACKPDNRCTRARETDAEPRTVAATVSRPERVASEIKNRRVQAAVERAYDDGAADKRKTLAAIEAAKAQLQAKGWDVSGKAFRNPETGDFEAVLSGAREDELVSLSWVSGRLVGSHYSLWNTEQPASNERGMPARRLTFDPDEMTDTEVVDAVRGMSVEWWNRIGTSVESGVIGNRLTLQTVYDGPGDPTPADRVITFVDHSSHMTRSFRLGALLKVG